MPDLSAIDWEAIGRSLTTNAVAILAILVVASVVALVARPIVHRLVFAALDRRAAESTVAELTAVERRKRVDTLEAFVVGVVRLCVVIGVFVLILAVLGLLPAIAGLGLLAAALAFAGQNLIRDYLNGVFILLENHFSIGDVVRIAGVAGTVEELSLRRTTLRDLDGTVHIVPNGQILVASNLTRTWGRINLDVTVAYGTDIDGAIGIVADVGRDLAADPVWKRRVLEPPQVERIEALGEFGVTLKILGNVRAADRWAAAGELRKRLLDAFRANGIELPRPARVVLAGDPMGEGAGASMRVLDGPTEDDLEPDGE
jgi:small conductance mechanosensitive channel